MLDVGCGTGADLELYSRVGCDVYGVDMSPAMLRAARRRLGDRADLCLCSAAQLPFKDKFFDLVLSTYTLHEIAYEDRSSVILEMMRVVKSDEMDNHVLVSYATKYGATVSFTKQLGRKTL